MIFHAPDATFKTLKSCWRRAEFMEKKGKIRKTHPLYIVWSNCKFLLDAEDSGCKFLPADSSKEVVKEYITKEIQYSIVLLDAMALKIQDYSKDHMLKNDKSIAAILYEWKQRMVFNPTLL
jgi:hypothetical protein